MDKREKSCLLCKHMVSGGGGGRLFCELYPMEIINEKINEIRAEGIEATLIEIAERCEGYIRYDEEGSDDL